jgi:hypothetical protein
MRRVWRTYPDKSTLSLWCRLNGSIRAAARIRHGVGKHTEPSAFAAAQSFEHRVLDGSQEGSAHEWSVIVSFVLGLVILAMLWFVALLGMQFWFTRPSVARRRMHAGMRRMYGDLFEELQLSSGAIDQFIQLLERQQTENAGLSRPSFRDPKADWRPFIALRNRHDAELEGVLGPAGLARYNDFHRHMGERMRLSQLRDRLAGTNTPLRPEQKAQLLEILVEERGRIRMPPLAGAGRSATTPGMYSLQLADHDEDYERRVRDRVAQVLTPAQLRQFNRGRTLDLIARRLNLWIGQAKRQRST